MSIEDENNETPSGLRAKLEAEIAKNRELSDKHNKLVESNRQTVVAATLTELKVPKEALGLLPDSITDAEGVKQWVESHKAVLKFEGEVVEPPVEEETPGVSEAFIAAEQRRQAAGAGADAAGSKDFSAKLEAYKNDEDFLNSPKSMEQVLADLKAQHKKMS